MPGDGELAVLFADLASSTQLYETFGNETGKDLVSRCVATMMATVNRHGGTVVRVIGDEVLTTFPTADAAIAAAVDMQDTVTATLAPDRRPLAIRIGLHSGDVLVGNVGSSERLSYTAMGDGVNVASPMEGLNKRFGTSICISGASTISSPTGWRHGLWGRSPSRAG